MSVKPVNLLSPQNRNGNAEKQKNQQNPSFKGGFNPIVTVMDAIDRGGFAASFIAQDGIGMVAPRIYEGLNRNRKKDENGKMTGPLNWEFARREGIREILSGPSAFLIPMGMLAFIKKWGGSANNVHISHINAIGESFTEFAKNNHNILANQNEAKREFYTHFFENILKESAELTSEELSENAKYFANTLLKIEQSSKKKETKALKNELTEKYMLLRKSHASASENELGAIYKLNNGNKLNTSIKRLMESLPDYTNDAIKSVKKHFDKSKSMASIEDFIKQFNHKRITGRVLSVAGMFSAVVGFYALIPKLYNIGLKKDPGLAGIEGAEEVQKEENKTAENTETKSEKSKEVTFKGGLGSIASTAGEKMINSKGFNKFFNKAEFNGASMSVMDMLALLFGFCLPSRYANAKSDYEKDEILVRDISSFTAILFGAKALSRGFSDMFSRITGLSLNTRPEDHDKSFFHKVKNYFTAGNGIDVLNSEQIVSKYHNIHEYKDGILGFVEFLENNGGNAKKVLGMDKTISAKMQEILGKPLKNASIEEIKSGLKREMEKDSSKALDAIYDVFKSKTNKFVQTAKTCNSAFGFASTIVLVPVFMMWLARFCERMTKERIAKEAAMKKAQPQQPQPNANLQPNVQQQNIQPISNKQTVSIQNFIDNKAKA